MKRTWTIIGVADVPELQLRNFRSEILTDTTSPSVRSIRPNPSVEPTGSCKLPRPRAHFGRSHMSVLGRVSRAPHGLFAVRNCTRDEGGPFEMLRAVNGSSVARRPASSLAIVEHIFG